MELAFDSRSLRTICESEADAKRELGPIVAEVLKHRLADMRAATSVRDLLVGKPRIISESDHHFMVIDLCEGYQLIFCANHPPNPEVEPGELDWQRVRRIKITRIERNYVR